MDHILGDFAEEDKSQINMNLPLNFHRKIEGRLLLGMFVLELHSIDIIYGTSDSTYLAMLFIFIWDGL